MTQIVYRPFGFRAISESAGVGNAENNDSSVARDSTNTDCVPSSVVDSRSNRPAYEGREGEARIARTERGCAPTLETAQLERRVDDVKSGNEMCAYEGSECVTQL